MKPQVRGPSLDISLSLGLLLVGMIAPLCRAQSLRRETDCTGILVGTAVRTSQFSESAYATTLVREFNMMQAEDVMKWSTIRPDRQTFNFTLGDQVVDFAQAHDMKVRGHTLVWGRHNPEWLNGADYNPGMLSELLRDHITKVVQHYRGKVFAWDVVNEALDENGELRSSIWYDRPGIGLAGKGNAYIEQAFRWAHAADPDVLLFYNDAEGEAVNHKSDAIYAIVKDFKRRGVPIDGIGLQMHIFDLQPDVASIAANIDRFTALGVQVHITELDVALPTDTSGNLRIPSDLLKQAEIYRQIAATCLSHRGCTALQTWGFTDKYSWIRSFFRGNKGSALLFDNKYNPKPAYRALNQTFEAVGCSP